MRPVLRFRYTPTSAQLTASFRYWIDYIVSGTGKAKREPVAGADDRKGYSIEEAKAAEGKRKAQKVESPRVLNLPKTGSLDLSLVFCIRISCSFRTQAKNRRFYRR
jgi:hypothetical protein